MVDERRFSNPSPSDAIVVYDVEILMCHARDPGESEILLSTKTSLPVNGKSGYGDFFGPSSAGGLRVRFRRAKERVIVYHRFEEVLEGSG